MSTGILTFIHTLNYGAELQAFGLSYVLSKLSFSNELISYTCTEVEKREIHPFPKFTDIKNPKHFIGLLIRYFYFYKKIHNFSNFENQWLRFGNQVKDSSEILKSYSYIIIGSDQVWCPQITGNDLTYVLDGSHKTKQKVISYAASFGDKPFPDSYKAQFSRALKCFDALSVREKRGLEIINEMGITDAVVSLDPTLLLTGNEWLKVAKPVKVPNKYVFAYIVSERDKTLEYAKYVAKRFNAKLLYIDAYSSRPILGAKNMGACGPDEFLWLVKNAEMVITSSFHGLCFSILFNKQFRYALSAKKHNSRLYNLASRFNLEKYDITNFDLDDQIDYSEPNRSLAVLRENSINYLRRSLR